MSGHYLGHLASVRVMMAEILASRQWAGVGAGLLGPPDAVDEAITAAGKAAKRSDGKLPPHVMVYFAMAMALFAEEDYEEVAARLSRDPGVVGMLGRRVGRADLGRDHPGPAAGTRAAGTA